MDLMNMTTKKVYPMKKVGPYTLFTGELAIDRAEQSVEWYSQSKVYEAVLLGAPKVEVLEGSKEGHGLLRDCLLEIRIDGAPASATLALLGEKHTLSMGSAERFWFGGVEGESVRGIFLSNGSLVQAIVRSPRKVQSTTRIRITIEAELYTARGSEDRPEASPMDPSVKTAKEIGEVIQRAEHQDWSMVATADLIKHSVGCTSDMCLMLNTARPLTCSCGRGIHP